MILKQILTKSVRATRAYRFQVHQNHFFSFSELKQETTTSQTQYQTNETLNTQNKPEIAPSPKKMTDYQEQLARRYPPEKIAEVQKKLDEEKGNLFAYLLAVNKDSSNNFNYVSDTLISNKIDYKYLKGNPKQIFFLLGMWSSAGYLASLVSPYLVSLPAIMGIGATFSFFGGRKFVSKTVEKIELVPNEIEKLSITLIKGKEKILCRMDTIEIIDVSDKAEHPYISEKVFREENRGINLQKDISIIFNVQDVAGVNHNALNLILFGNKKLTNVPNYNLLTTILQGDIIKLNKFKVNAKQQELPSDFIDQILSGKIKDEPAAIEDKQKTQGENKGKEEEIEEQIQLEIQRFSKKSMKKERSEKQ